MSLSDSAANKAVELSGLDISLFFLTLAVSVLIGIYFANKNSTFDEYMRGGRNQSLWPVATSMMTSFMSGLTLIGNPAELYYHGPTFACTAAAMIISTPITAFVLLPIFHRLDNLSIFTYLEQRFNRKLQRALSLVFMVGMLFYNALVLYVPSLSLRSVLGVSETISIGAVGLACIVYCTLGGIKAVIWTDFFQAGLMYLSLICICIGGTIEVGGISNLFSTNQAGGRLVFEPLLNLDLTTRHTLLTIGTGSLLQNIFMNGANQIQVQRALSLPTLRLAQWASLITTTMTAIVSILASYIGLILFVNYQHCDPFGNHEIDKRDAIVLRYIGTHLSFIPGLRGIFISGVFAATLSTLSSFQNSMSALVIEDFVKPNLRKPMSEKAATYLGKGLALLFGVVCIGLTFLAGQVSSLLQAAITLHGSLSGSFLAVFFLGMMTRFVNTLGVSIGLFISLAFGAYLQIGQAFRELKPSLALSIDNCENNSTDIFQSIIHETTLFAHNQTSAVQKTVLDYSGVSSEFKLSEISYLWLPFLLFTTCAVVSVVVSLLSGGWSQQVDDRYLVGWLHSSQEDDNSLRDYSFDNKLSQTEDKKFKKGRVIG